MNAIEVIITANLFTFYFINQARFPEKWNINFKPFNCTMCLSAWSSLLIYFIPSYIQYPILITFASGVSAPLIKNFLTNLYFSK